MINKSKFDEKGFNKVFSEATISRINCTANPNARKNNELIKRYTYEYYKKILQTLAVYLNKDKSSNLLDIGASEHIFLIKKIFPNEKIYTIDLTNKWEKECKEKGIYFKQCDLTQQSIPFSNNQFDIILCGEVIEHLFADINSLLKEFYLKLNKKGILVISTPNFAQMNARLKVLLGKNAMPMFKEESMKSGDLHVREYTLKELTSMLEKNGFDVVKEEYYQVTDKLRFSLVNKKWPYYLIRAILSKFLPQLRSRILVIARKID